MTEPVAELELNETNTEPEAGKELNESDTEE